MHAGLYYNGHAVRAAETGFAYAPRYSSFPRTTLKWPVTPKVTDWGVRFLQERYSLPGYISENSLSCNERIDFLARYLSCPGRAAESGADIRSHFHWTLTDNFE